MRRESGSSVAFRWTNHDFQVDWMRMVGHAAWHLWWDNCALDATSASHEITGFFTTYNLESRRCDGIGQTIVKNVPSASWTGWYCMLLPSMYVLYRRTLVSSYSSWPPIANNPLRTWNRKVLCAPSMNAANCNSYYTTYQHAYTQRNTCHPSGLAFLFLNWPTIKESNWERHDTVLSCSVVRRGICIW